MRRVARILITFIALFALFACLFFVIANWAAVSEKLGYWFGSERYGHESVDGFGQNTEIVPPDDRLIIPKLAVNVPLLFPDSTADEAILTALQNGVAHYPNTALPGQTGNVFITGHSSQLAWEEGRYKNVFALLEKLESDDVILVYFHKQKFVYTVTDSKKVDPSDLSVLNTSAEPLLTLMTCWPTGTTARRLIVTATLDGPAAPPIQSTEPTGVVQPELEAKELPAIR